MEPPPNEPPIANDDFVTISENMNPGPQIPVLTNDNDGDGDELIVTNVEEPNNGNVEISEDEKGVVYTPEEGFTGVDCKFFFFASFIRLWFIYVYVHLPNSYLTSFVYQNLYLQHLNIQHVIQAMNVIPQPLL